MERVWEPVVGDGRTGGAQRLRRDLAAVQREPVARAGLVLPAEEVAVEPLELEQLGERRGRHAGATGATAGGGVRMSHVGAPCARRCRSAT